MSKRTYSSLLGVTSFVTLPMPIWVGPRRFTLVNLATYLEDVDSGSRAVYDAPMQGESGTTSAVPSIVIDAALDAYAETLTAHALEASQAAAAARAFIAARKADRNANS